MKGQMCSIITPSLGLGFASSPEVTKESYTPPFRLCLRNRKSKSSSLNETVTAAPPFSLPTNFVTSVTSRIVPVSADVGAPVAAISTITTPTTTTTTTVVSSVSGPITTTAELPLSDYRVGNDKSNSVFDYLDTGNATENRVSNDKSNSVFDYLDTGNPSENFTDSNPDAHRPLIFSSNDLQRSVQYCVPFTEDTDDTEIVVDNKSEEPQQERTNFTVTDNLGNAQNFLTLHTKCLTHHKPFSKSKQCLNERLTVLNHQPSLNDTSESYNNKEWNSNKVIYNGEHVNTILDSQGNPVCSGISSKCLHDDRCHQSKTSLPDQYSRSLPGKWIVKRDFHSAYLPGTGYGERNNVWSKDNVQYQNNTSDKVSSAHSDTEFKKDSENLGSETDKNVWTLPSVGTLSMQASGRDKATHNLLSTRSSLPCLLSQAPDIKSSSLNSTMPTSITPVWLARRLRKLCKIRHDEFRKKCFLGNNLSFQEFHEHQLTSRKLLYQKCRGINLHFEERTRNSSTTSETSNGPIELHSPLDSLKYSTDRNLSQSPYTSTTIPLSPSSTEVHGTAIEIESNIPSSSSFSSSTASGKSSKPTYPTTDVPLTNPSSSEHAVSNLYTALPNSTSKDADKEITKSDICFQDISTEKHCQEMIDYFWSYQGMGRQVLGMRSPSVSLQSSMWEREKIGAARQADNKLLRDRYQELHHKSTFSRHPRLPPILITDYDDPSKTTRGGDVCSHNRSVSDMKQKSTHDRQSHNVDKKERKRRGKKHRTKADLTRVGLTEKDLEQPESTETKGGNKLRLVVKLPPLQKSADDE